MQLSQGGLLEIPRGRAVSKVKIFKGKFEQKLEQPEGWGGGNPKIPSVGGAQIFSGISQFNKFEAFFYFLFLSSSFHLLSTRNYSLRIIFNSRFGKV